MAVEVVGLRIEVQDDGTPVVKRHAAEAKRELAGIEAASKSAASGAAGATGAAATATGRLTQGMGKAQQAAVALSGGLSQAGGATARLTSAISTLLLTGFNPVGIAIGAAAVGLGMLVESHNAAAEAAREQARAVAELRVEAARAAAELHDLRFGTDTAELAALQERHRDVLAKIKAAEAGLGRFSASGFVASGSMSGLVPEWLTAALGSRRIKDEPKEDLARLRAEEERIVAAMGLFGLRRDARAEGEARAEAEKRIDSGSGPWRDPNGVGQSFAEFLEGLDKAGDALDRLAEKDRLSPPGQELLAADPNARAAYLQGLTPAQRRAMFGGEATGFMGTPAPGMSLDAELANLASADLLGRNTATGRAAGGAYADAFVDAAASALRGGDALRTLSSSITDITTRAFMDALFGNRLRQALEGAFSAAFAALGGGGKPFSDVLRGGGSGGGGFADPGNIGTAEAGAIGPDSIRVVVQPAPVVSEQVLRAANPRAAKAWLSGVTAPPGTRGRSNRG